MCSGSPSSMARPWNEQQQGVGGDCLHRMQRVKADAATVRIVEGCGEQVIEVHKRRGDYDRPSAAPASGEENPRDEAGKHNVQRQM